MKGAFLKFHVFLLFAQSAGGSCEALAELAISLLRKIAQNFI